jgi:predicted MPP superfamily phosphohydrolase
MIKIGSFYNVSKIDKTVLDYKHRDSLNISDGPYIFINNDTLIMKNIINGTVEAKIIKSQSVESNFTPEPSIYNNVSKIAVLSDLHGQYNLTMDILKVNEIIDNDLNWTFGNGHLVILGDVFDRGDEVTELLWFIYYLEKQAEISGGKVHFVLGNHEYMTMRNDLRYMNKKYRYAAYLLKTPYSELYGRKTLLGRWLRSKSTIIQINDNLFVHAGISRLFIEDGYNLEETNQHMRQSLFQDEKENEKVWDSIYGKFYDEASPIWYRGYFDPEFKKSEINRILRKVDANHIVVGHTSFKQIVSLFDNKILAVDSGIKNGIYGELLLIKDDNYYRCTLEGERIKIN